MTADRSLFQRANHAADLVAIAGVKLRGGRGACPLCNRGDAKDTAFSVSKAKALWKCFRCGEGGDAVQLEQALHGGSLRQAALRILGETEADQSVERDRAFEEKRARRLDADRKARQRRAERSAELSAKYHIDVIGSFDVACEPAAGSAFVRRWLSEARAIPLEHLGDALQILAATTQAHHSEDFDTGERWRANAMIASIEDADTGERIGRHVTYLQADGSAKADLEPARKIWGGAKGGVWLTGRDNALGPLFVGEGIETVLSCLSSWRRKHGLRAGRAVAVLSLGNLQGGVLKDKWDRFDITRPVGDPAKRPVTWANAGEVVICVDRDMRPVPAKLRKPGGGSEKRDLTQDERMELSAMLAAEAWREAGATSVRIARPDPGTDFNDMLRMARRQDMGGAA